MIFFDVMMTLIEDFIIAYFDFKILNINNKKLIFFFCAWEFLDVNARIIMDAINGIML